MSQEHDAPIAVLTAAEAEGHHDGPRVVITRTLQEVVRWLRDPAPDLKWLQVENLLGHQDVWAGAAQGISQLPLDVILTDPATEFSSLYRLVDVRIVRGVRVTMPGLPGFMKALRLAASLQLPVRLLPGQPSAVALAELTEAAAFYLHDPMVETPVEFFHSLLAAFRGMRDGTLWGFLEEDPALFSRRDAAGRALHAPDFIETRLAHLLHDGAECATCQWQSVCAGYFKWPDPTYACAGVKQLFAMLEAAAEEIGRDLASQETSSAL